MILKNKKCEAVENTCEDNKRERADFFYVHLSRLSMKLYIFGLLDETFFRDGSVEDWGGQFYVQFSDIPRLSLQY